MREIKGGAKSLPAQLSYSVNYITDVSIGKYFRFPDGRTGQKVEIIKNVDSDIFIYPPNDVSFISGNPYGNFIKMDSSEKYLSFVCVKNPTQTIWVNSSNPPATGISSVYLGDVSVSHTNGVQTSWYGTDASGLTGSTRMLWSDPTATAQNLNGTLIIDSDVDTWSLKTFTDKYRVAGYRIYTDIDIASTLDVYATFSVVRCDGTNTLIAPSSGLIRHTSGYYNDGFDPTFNRFVKSYYNKNTGTNCFMFDFSDKYNGATYDNYPYMSSTPKTNVAQSPVTPFYYENGWGEFNLELIFGASMATNIYNFSVEADVDIQN